MRYFVDINGVIFTIYDDNTSNYPGDFEIVGSDFRSLGVKDCLGEGREIVDEYVIWDSLVELAQAIEDSE